MYLVAALFFWFIGVTMLFKPEFVFKIRESRKYNSPTEPSERYIRGTRIGGVIYLLVGVLSFAAQFMM